MHTPLYLVSSGCKGLSLLLSFPCPSCLHLEYMFPSVIVHAVTMGCTRSCLKRVFTFVLVMAVADMYYYILSLHIALFQGAERKDIVLILLLRVVGHMCNWYVNNPKIKLPGETDRDD